MRKFRNQSTNELLSIFDQVAKNSRDNQGYNYKVGADYFMNKKTTLGLVVNGLTAAIQNSQIIPH
jgi:iron complex outermembrane receptor protein